MENKKAMDRDVRLPKLSDRLMAVASLVTEGNSVCDVGCDHGFVPLYLVLEKKSPRVIAMDVRQGPLSRAQQHIAQYHAEEWIETRLSDGLSAYEAGEADSLIAAGMGGPLMLRILEAFPEKTGSFKELILQPQSEIAQFRKRLRELGLKVADERMVFEDGKYYPMMKIVQTSGIMKLSGDDLQDAYGPILLERGDPVLAQYLLWERRIIDGILEKKSDLENWKRKSELNAAALHMIQQ